VDIIGGNERRVEYVDGLIDGRVLLLAREKAERRLTKSRPIATARSCWRKTP
jgi:hypothetical protein